MISDIDLFIKMKPSIEALPDKVEFSQEDLFIESLRLYRKSIGRKLLDIYYVPMDYVNEEAKVTLVGITPGLTQMKTAFKSAKKCLREGLSPEEVLMRASNEGSFCGPTRKYLVNMLNGIGLAYALRLKSCDELFAENSRLVHNTSAIRDPAFIDSDNYGGYSPQLTRIPIFRHYILNSLANELNSVDGSLIIPMGNSVSSALELLISKGLLDRERCLIGFPHPSGGSPRRIELYEKNRDDLSVAVEKWFS